MHIADIDIIWHDAGDGPTPPNDMENGHLGDRRQYESQTERCEERLRGLTRDRTQRGGSGRRIRHPRPRHAHGV